MWLKSLLKVPRGPFTMTVRPFSETPTADQSGHALRAAGAAPPSAPRKRRRLTLLGNVHGLVAEDGLHPAGDNETGWRLSRPCACGAPARSSLRDPTAPALSPPGPGARRPQRGLAGKAPSLGPPARGAGQEAPAGPGAAPGSCPRAGGAPGGREPRMIPDYPGDPERSRRRHQTSPCNAQGQKRQRMTSSRTCSRSGAHDVIASRQPSDRREQPSRPSSPIGCVPPCRCCCRRAAAGPPPPGGCCCRGAGPG